ncbi:hypothetical protein LT493_00090 [Streptomyces tricolor]|nr:hypothetical protein [Streptomyces tricolor]
MRASRMSRPDRPLRPRALRSHRLSSARSRLHYLAAHAPRDLRWAVAGRDEGRLERLRESLPGGPTRRGPAGRTSPNRPPCAPSPSIARVVATTGERTCATARTLSPPAPTPAPRPHLDLTGEPEFVGPDVRPARRTRA